MEKTRVPLLDLRRQYLSIRAEVDAAVGACLEDQAFILGPRVEAFESQVAAYLGVPHAIGVSSGSDALLMALMALDIGPGDEVITTPFSFFATAGAIARLGARPVFCDVDPRTGNLDPAKLEGAYSARSRAVIPVHLFGQACELEAVLAWAGAKGLPVVEDAAQALGAARHGAKLGTRGAMGCFSFFPSKNLGAAGDGGLIACADPALADRLRRLRNHGGARKYHYEEVGGNFRLDALQAAILSAKLPRLDGWNAARRAHAGRYRELLGGVPAETLVESPGNAHIYNQFCLLCDKRDDLREHLADRGVGTEVYYPLPLHLQPCFRHLGYGRGDFPAAESLSERILALPVFPELAEAELAYVAGRVREFFGARA